MARKVASPKNTGGGGYNFEDEVTAWWLLNLLAGRSPLELAMGAPLQTLTARRLRVEAMTWLSPLQTSFPPQELVGLLELVWNEHPAELGRHVGARSAFDSLLSVLAVRHSGRAILFSQQVARSQ